MYWNKVETLSDRELKEIQLKRLKKLIKRVYTKSNFYKDKFDLINLLPKDIKSLDDIKKLPFTTKNDLRDNYPYNLFTAPMNKIIRLHSSSGTTGKPTIVGYTKKDIKNWDNIMARVLYMCDVREEDIVHNAYGYGLFTGGLGFHNGVEKINATIVPANTGYSDRQLMLLKDLKSTVLCCTPSYALHLSNLVEDKEKYCLKKGIFGAEAITKGLKEKIKEAWNIDYYEIYGLSEIIGPGVACSCKYSEDLHIFEDYFYPEIIDTKTNEVLDYGKEGELVLTTLKKEAIPLIRYKTGDITTLIKRKCKCGRTFIQMKPVFSRVDDMMIVNGVNVYPLQIQEILEDFSKIIKSYKINLDKSNSLSRLKIVIKMNKNIDINNLQNIEEFKKNLHIIFLNKLYINVDIEII